MKAHFLYLMRVKSASSLTPAFLGCQVGISGVESRAELIDGDSLESMRLAKQGSPPSLQSSKPSAGGGGRGLRVMFRRDCGMSKKWCVSARVPRRINVQDTPSKMLICFHIAERLKKCICQQNVEKHAWVGYSSSTHNYL